MSQLCLEVHFSELQMVISTATEVLKVEFLVFDIMVISAIII